MEVEHCVAINSNCLQNGTPVAMAFESCMNSTWDLETLLLLPRDLSAVSSQYGPGSVLAWLLAALSVSLSWAFEVQNDKKGATLRFSADFVATVLFPLVAIGDGFWRLCRPLGRIRTTRMDDQILRYKVHPVEAPVAVAELTIMISIPLLAIAIARESRRRVTIIGFLNIAALSLEIFLLVQARRHQHSALQTVTPYFHAKSLFYLCSLWFCIPSLPFILSTRNEYNRSMHKKKTASNDIVDGTPGIWAMDVIEAGRPAPQVREQGWLPQGETVLVFIMFFALVSHTMDNVRASSKADFIRSNITEFSTLYPNGPGEGFSQSLVLFFHSLVPATPCSITDLDQMFAFLAGLLLLLLNVYGLVRQRMRQPILLP